MFCYVLFYFPFVVRRCSSLEAPQFGFIYPQNCATLPVSGTVCYLDCRHGFESNGGLKIIQCGKDGKWNKDDSLIMKCLGMLLERINCSSKGHFHRAFLHDVTEAILAFQNNETAAMLVYQENPLGVELFSHVNAFFCSSKLA